MTTHQRPAYVGIDLAIAKKKYLPLVACTLEDGELRPLALHVRGNARKPPRGMGNQRVIESAAVHAFALEVLNYLKWVETDFNVAIERIAIDAPRAPRQDAETRRASEQALDKIGISYFTTPSWAEFGEIRSKVRHHLANGGSQSTFPHANQLWMLAGFELFRVLVGYECIEVYPHAIGYTLNTGVAKKSTPEGVTDRLTRLASHTGWPPKPDASALNTISFGPTHDKLDAYMSAWVASLPESGREALGNPPQDAIWIPKLASK